MVQVTGNGKKLICVNHQIASFSYLKLSNFFPHVRIRARQQTLGEKNSFKITIIFICL